MNKARIETRKRQFKEKMNDPNYLPTTIEKQRSNRKENDTRKRIA